MKKNLAIPFLFAILCFLSFESSAQTGFQRYFGGAKNDFGYAGLQTADNGYAVFGYTKSFGSGSWDYYLMKMDSAGVFSWAKSYGGSGDDEGYSVAQTKDGGFILCGYSKSFGAGGYDVYLVKTNATGDTLWTKTYGGTQNDFGNAVIQTADGGYLVAGSTLSFPAGKDTSSAYLIKTDALGRLQWSKSYGGTTKQAVATYTDGYGVQQTSDKGYVLTGYTNGFGEVNGDAFLLKTDSLGNLAFTKTYGGKGVDWGTSVSQTRDGGYVLAGSLCVDSTNTDNDVLLIKTNPNGDTLFTKTFSGSGYDYAQTVLPTPAGYLLAGSTTSFGGGGYDGFLLKTDLSGDTIFSNAYGGSFDDNVNGLSLCSNGDYALFGSSQSFGANSLSKFYQLRTDTNGNGFCNRSVCPFLKKRLMVYTNTVTAQVTISATRVAPANTQVSAGGLLSDACGHVDVKDPGSVTGYLKIYPNPCSGLFRLSLGNIPAADLTIQLTNILGQCIFSVERNNRSASFSEEFNVEQIPEGLYMIRIRTGEGVLSGNIIVRN